LINGTPNIAYPNIAYRIAEIKIMFNNLNNFLNDATTVNGDIKIYKNQASTGYMDNFSITQAKDLMVLAWQKNASASYKTLVATRPESSYGFAFGTYNDKNLSTIFVDNAGTASSFYQSTNVTVDNTWSLAGFILNRSAGTIAFIHNGTLESTQSITPANLGKISASGLRIGSSTALGYWNGQIGETQITTFSDISTVNYTPAQIFALSKYNGQYFPRIYTGGTEVLYMKMDDATDESSYGHVFTNNGTVTFGTVAY